MKLPHPTPKNMKHTQTQKQNTNMYIFHNRQFLNFLTDKLMNWTLLISTPVATRQFFFNFTDQAQFNNTGTLFGENTTVN